MAAAPRATDSPAQEGAPLWLIVTAGAGALVCDGARNCSPHIAILVRVTSLPHSKMDKKHP